MMHVCCVCGGSGSRILQLQWELPHQPCSSHPPHGAMADGKPLDRLAKSSCEVPAPPEAKKKKKSKGPEVKHGKFGDVQLVSVPWSL